VDGGGGGGELVDQVHHHSVSGAHAYGATRQQPACMSVSVQEHGIISCQVSQIPAEVTFTVLTDTKYKIWPTQHVKAVPNVVKMLKTMLLSLILAIKNAKQKPDGSSLRFD